MVVEQVVAGNKFNYGHGAGVLSDDVGKLWGEIVHYDEKTGKITVDLSGDRRVVFNTHEVFAWINQGLLVLDEGDELKEIADNTRPKNTDEMFDQIARGQESVSRGVARLVDENNKDELTGDDERW